jgi:hypothetical protein
LVARRGQLLEMLVAEEHRLQHALPELRKEVRQARTTEILRSVPRVGKVLSWMLLAKLPELGTLKRK